MRTFTKLTKMLTALALAAMLLPASGASAASPADQIIVKIKPGVDGKALAEKHGAKFKKTSASGYEIVKVPPGASADALLAKFQRDAGVESAELDQLVTIEATPNDPSYGSQYHLQKIQANFAWDINTGSTSSKIAVVSTGVDLQHPDLSSKILPGYDFVNATTNADDDHGLGTHLAGIAAAATNNGTQGSGVDWNARIIPVKVLNANGTGYTSDIEAGVRWAADQGAKVILMGFGSSASYSATMQSAIDYAWSKGAVLVAPAGDLGNTTVQYPANYTNVISVACTTSTDTKCSFSSYGMWVDLAAPGQSIYSTANGGGMTTMSGTSQSAAVVAGVASLVWSRYGTSASPSTIVNKLFTTADQIPGTGSYWYRGRVNAYRAVTQ